MAVPSRRLFYISIMTIRGLYDRIAAIDTDQIAIEAIEETTAEIRHFQLKQLLDGKNNTGGDMSSYLNDPFFKTPQAAQAYSRWKDEISPKTNRRSGIKNYYINGYYHNSIVVKVVGDKVVTESNNEIGKDIEQKEPGIYGLSPQSRTEYIPKVLRPRFVFKMAQATGLKFK